MLLKQFSTQFTESEMYVCLVPPDMICVELAHLYHLENDAE
jgi:hypothetical protein